MVFLTSSRSLIYASFGQLSKLGNNPNLYKKLSYLSDKLLHNEIYQNHMHILSSIKLLNLKIRPYQTTPYCQNSPSSEQSENFDEIESDDADIGITKSYYDNQRENPVNARYRTNNLNFANSSTDEKFNTMWKLYKTSVIGQFRPIKPTFERIRIGGWGIIRQGTLLVELASTFNGNSKKIDWDNKMNFALRANELGDILASPHGNHEFYHDPKAFQSSASGSTKILSLNPAEEKGWHLTLKTKDDVGDDKQITLAMTPGEFEVFKSIARYMLPRMLGVDAVYSNPLIK